MRTRPTRAALEQAGRWRLAFRERNTGGVAGRHLARTSGSSLEFQDRRAYQPGDDVRNLDWRAFARTDQLLVKVHREEVLPRLELLVDGSRSMAVDAAKAELAADVARVLADAARIDGCEVRCILLGDEVRRIEPEELELGFPFEARAPLETTLHAAVGFLRAGSLRLLLSDFLSPHEPRALVRPLANNAGGLALVQVLGTHDAEPMVGEALRLEDAETGESIELVLEADAVRTYQSRLANLTRALETECRRAAAPFARTVAGPAIDEVCRATLAPAGILAPA